MQEKAEPGRLQQVLANRKKDAAERLFEYIYLLRYGRGPLAWEWLIGWALISGSLTVVNPNLEAPLLAAIHAAAADVRPALGIVEEGSR